MIGGAVSRITVEIGGRLASSLNRSLRAAQSQVSSLGQNVNRSLADASRGFRGVIRSDAFQTAAVAAGGLTLAIGGSVRAAMEFESAMADVRKVVDFPTPQAFADMQRDIMQLSREIPISATGFTEIIAAAGQAGIAREELTRFARSAAQMGVAFDISAAEAGEAMAKLRTSMALDQGQVEQLADAMNHLSNSMASSAPQITDFMLRTGALGKQIAITTEQQAALGSAMIAAGAEPEVAATSFRNLVRALTKGDSATNRQADAMERLGLTTTQVARAMQQDAVGTIQDVFARLNQMPAEMRVALSSDIFGDEARALAPLITNAELMSGALAEVGDSSRYTGSMLREFQARSATAGNQIQLFRNNVNGLGIAIGSAVLPAINRFFTAITPLISGLVDLATEFPVVTAAVVGVGTALIGLVAIAPFVASFISVLGSLKLALAGLSLGATIAGWAGAIGPAIAGIAAVVTGPIGLTVAAIAGIGTALVLAYQKVEWFRNGVNAIWSGIVQVFQGVVTYLGGAWKVLTGILTGDSNRAKEGIAQAFGGLRQIFGTIFDGIKAVWAGFTGFIGGLIQQAVGLFQQFGPTVLAIMFPIPAAILGAFGQLPPGVQGVFNQVVAFIQGVPGQLVDVGRKIIDTIIDGIKARASALVETVRATFAEVRNLMPFSDAKEGPFKYLTSSGKAIITTLAHGVSEAAPRLTRAMDSAAAGAMGALGGATMAPAMALAGAPSLTAAGVPVRSRPMVPSYSPIDVPAPGPGAGRGGMGSMSMSPTVNVNVAGSSSTADDIAEQVMRVFQDMLGEAEASVRAYLND